MTVRAARSAAALSAVGLAGLLISLAAMAQTSPPARAPATRHEETFDRASGALSSVEGWKTVVRGNGGADFMFSPGSGLQSPPGPRALAICESLATAPATDFHVEVSVDHGAGGVGAGVVFGYRDEDNFIEFQLLDGRTRPGGAGKDARLRRRVQGSESDVFHISELPDIDAGFHLVRAEYRAADRRVLLRITRGDGAPYFEREVELEVDAGTRFGISAWSSGKTLFRGFAAGTAAPAAAPTAGARPAAASRIPIEPVARPVVPPPPPSVSAPLPATLLPAKPGQISGEIACQGRQTYSYHLYLPRSFDPSRSWPAMFVMAPAGGGEAVLRRYIPGAERVGWILATSVQACNRNKMSGEAVLAMVNDLRVRLPVDRQRMYASGGSGGSRMAFGLASELNGVPLAGVLACAGGASPRDTLSSKTVLYGLCGSNCFNRWDMACTFRKFANRDSRLVYFPGNHDWAGEEQIEEGMAWLEMRYLQRSVNRRELNEARDGFAREALRRIEEDLAGRPEHAWEWAAAMAEFPGPRDVQARIQQHHDALKRLPTIQSYVDARADADRFVEKYFATDPMDYLNNNGNRAVATAAEKLAEKHKNTVLRDLFVRMGQPSVKPVPGGP